MWALLGGEGQPGSLERAEGGDKRQRVAQGRGQMSHSWGGGRDEEGWGRVGQPDTPLPGSSSSGCPFVRWGD